jgi:hypothetical protein
MKKHYFYLLFAILFSGAFAKAQTTLGPGDLVIISLEADTPDTFRFVPLVDLLPGTVIEFTENGVFNGVLESNESTVTYTAPPGGITAGTNIIYSADATIGDPNFTGGNTGLSTAGDQIHAYQGTATSPVFIFSAMSNSTIFQPSGTSSDSNQSELPPGLTDGANAVAAGSGPGPEEEWDNIYYTGITSGTAAAILASVANASNWSGNNSKDPASETTVDFTIQAGTTNPSVTITAPSDGTTIPATSTVDVQFSVANFNFSTDGDMSFTVSTGGTAVSSILTDANPETVNVSPGETYVVTAQLRDTNGQALSNPEAQSQVTFTVDFPCDLSLDFASATTTCDTSTSGIDTYSASIDFTGGNTGVTYDIIVPAGVTVAGDSPDTNAIGTIQLGNMQEGDDTLLVITGNTGSSCDLAFTFFSPTCLLLPITEQFDYTAGDFLTDQLNWTPTNSGDEIIVSNGNLSVTGLAPSVGNHVTFDESGQDAELLFTPETSGTVYASFAFQVSSFQTGTSIDYTDGGYFAILSDGGGGFQSRLWVRPIEDTATMMPGTTYEIGYGAETSNPQFASGTYNLGDTVFVVMTYDIDNGEANLFINPDSTTFGVAQPATADIVSIDSSPATEIGEFQLRQDSSNETPFMLVDELRIATSYAAVTPTMAASIDDASIAGFEMYPNPVAGDYVTIKTLQSTEKSVTIFNVLGKQVLSTSFSSNQDRVDVSFLNSGLYIVKITDGDVSESRKLIIK